MPQLQAMLEAAGFERIDIRVKQESKEMIDNWMPGTNAGEYALSAVIQAVKPKN